MADKPKIVRCDGGIHPLERRHMTVKQLAQRFQVETGTVYRWIAKGLITPLRIGRAIRFKREDVERIGEPPTREQRVDNDPLHG